MNPKTYPYWKELVVLLQDAGHELVQIGITDEERLVGNFLVDRPLKEIVMKLKECDTFISVDSFLPHLATHLQKRGIVIFSKSDPNIFGYTHNINLLKSREYLRKNQFEIWEVDTFIPEAFVSPSEVMEALWHFE